MSISGYGPIGRPTDGRSKDPERNFCHEIGISLVGSVRVPSWTQTRWRIRHSPSLLYWSR